MDWQTQAAYRLTDNNSIPTHAISREPGFDTDGDVLAIELDNGVPAIVINRNVFTQLFYAAIDGNQVADDITFGPDIDVVCDAVVAFIAGTNR